MAYSFKTLKANFWKYFGNFYNYLLFGIYWGSVPAIILYGLFSKPYSPIILSLWSMLTGEEEQPQPGMYGHPGGFQWSTLTFSKDRI